MEQEVDFVVCAVLPASGQGLRMSIPTPKQYCKVLDKPLLLFSIEAFHRLSWVERVVVVADKGSLDYVRGLMVTEGLDRVTVVEGGATRHHSIHAGVTALETVCPGADVVLIHDAVRPVVEDRVIKAVTMAARAHGAAGVVRLLVSTVISTDQAGFLQQSLDRDKYRASEMPQAFQYDIIKTAYHKSTDHDLDFGTECLQLVLSHTGTRAKLIDGPASLWKVTNKKDLYAAEGILKEEHIHVGVVAAADDLTRRLIGHFNNASMKVSTAKSYTELPTGVTDVIVFQTTVSESRSTDMSACVLALPALLSHLADLRMSSVISTPVVVLVFTCSETTDLYQRHPELHKQLSIYGEESGGIVYAIVAKVGCDEDKLCGLLKTLVWGRSSAMSGQVFILT